MYGRFFSAVFAHLFIRWYGYLSVHIQNSSYMTVHKISFKLPNISSTTPNNNLKNQQKRLTHRGEEEEVARFCGSLMKRRIICEGYLDCLNGLDFYRVNPIVLLDYNRKPKVRT